MVSDVLSHTADTSTEYCEVDDEAGISMCGSADFSSAGRDYSSAWVLPRTKHSLFRIKWQFFLIWLTQLGMAWGWQMIAISADGKWSGLKVQNKSIKFTLHAFKNKNTMSMRSEEFSFKLILFTYISVEYPYHSLQQMKNLLYQNLHWNNQEDENFLGV